jgi:hypothetical protein
MSSCRINPPELVKQHLARKLEVVDGEAPEELNGMD